MPHAASSRRRPSGRATRASARRAASEEVVGVQVAEHQVGVGHRGLLAAAAVARGPGLRAGTVGPHLERAERRGARDAAAARADLDHVDDGDRDRQAAPAAEAVDAVHLELVDLERPPTDHGAELGGGPAHVERQQVCHASAPAQVRGRQGAGRGPRLQQAYGEARGGLHGGDAAAGEHDQHLAGGTQPFEPPQQAAQVRLHALLHVDVGRGGAHAGVFADLRRDLGAQRDPDLRGHLGEDLGGAALVLRVAKPVQVADGDGAHAFGP